MRAWLLGCLSLVVCACTTVEERAQLAKDRLYLESAFARELAFIRDPEKIGMWLRCNDPAMRQRIDDVLVRDLGEDSGILFLAVVHDYEDFDCDSQTETWVIRTDQVHEQVGVWDHRRGEKGRFYNTMIKRTADAPEEVAVAYRLRLGSYTVKALLDADRLPHGPQATAIRESQPSNVFKRNSFW